MNSHLALTDRGTYAGVPDEYASEAVVAYAQSIENRTASTSWLTAGEEFGELRESVRRCLGL